MEEMPLTVDKRTIVKETVSVGCRVLLAATFIFACIHKIYNPYEFALQVATYQILPLSLVNFQAIALPWVELVAAMALLVGFWTRPAALVTCGMNIMFIAAIVMALRADLHLQCGCFASASAGEEMDMSLVFRDVGLFVAGAFLVYAKPDRFTLDRWLAGRRTENENENA